MLVAGNGGYELPQMKEEHHMKETKSEETLQGNGEQHSREDYAKVLLESAFSKVILALSDFRSIEDGNLPSFPSSPTYDKCIESLIDALKFSERISIIHHDEWRDENKYNYVHAYLKWILQNIRDLRVASGHYLDFQDKYNEKMNELNAKFFPPGTVPDRGLLDRLSDNYKQVAEIASDLDVALQDWDIQYNATILSIKATDHFTRHFDADVFLEKPQMLDIENNALIEMQPVIPESTATLLRDRDNYLGGRT